MDSSADHSFTTTYIGWTVLLGVGSFLVYYYNDPRKRAALSKNTAQAKQDLGKDVASATAAMKKKAEKALKPKPKSKPTPSQSDDAAATTSDYNPSAEAATKRDEAKANQDFAQSLAKIKSGLQFSSKKAEKQKQKSVKQSRAQEAETPAAAPSAPSSTAGDADDDLSSAASPVAAPADKSGVSDMLEAATPGPSVLRLTDTVSSSKPASKKEKAPAVVESKKARQNRLKAERKKLEREQEEAERKKLEEAQRRRARIAEGRPAKDGSSFTANKENAWTAKANGSTPLIPVQPLDTFEQEPVAPAASLPTPKPATTGTKERSDSWMSATLLSEEEQIAQAKEDSSAWNEVTTKKGKKGKKTQEAAPEYAAKAPAAPAAQAPTPVARSTVNGNKSKPALSSNSSFAALAPEETADDDDVEEEWEV